MSLWRDSDQRARVRSELRLGLPVRLTATAGPGAVAIAAELIEPHWLDALRALGAGEPVLALSRFRAETLRIRCYDGDLARVRLTHQLDAPAIATIADPSRDLSHPMKGPFAECREGDAAPARAALTLARAAGLLPAAVVTEPADPGDAGLAELVTIPIEQALTPQPVPRPIRISAAELPLGASEECRVTLFREPATGDEHLALEVGQPDPTQPVLARVHSSCYTGDVLDSLRCDCGPQLRGAVDAIAQAGGGVIVLLQQEGRGIGLANKLRAYTLQDQGFDTFEANRRLGFAEDERSFTVAAAILRELGCTQIRLLSDNPDKATALSDAGIAVVERVPHTADGNPHNARYLDAKARRHRKAA